MKAAITAVALIVTATAPALAADVVRPFVPPPSVAPAAYDWTGHYVGVDAGYLWGDAVVHSSTPVAGGKISGFIGGVLGGFNVLHNGHILGLEGDWGWTRADGHGGGIVDTYTYDLDWTAHLRARFGVPMGDNLWFIAGGAAFAGFDVFEDVRRGGVYTGWTAGAGLDHAFSPQLIGRAEVLYDNFGSKTYSDFSASLTGWTARVALIYRFGPH